MARKRKPRSIVIVGRRWFNRGPGNTYHSAVMIVDGKTVGKIDFAYGYGDQYEYNAFNWLAKNGYIEAGEHVIPWQWAKANKVHLVSTVTDVARRKDL
jgi:hypothetical protein